MWKQADAKAKQAAKTVCFWLKKDRCLFSCVRKGLYTDMIIAMIGKLLLALAVGYFLNKKGILTPEVSRSISYLVMNIALPLISITSVSNMQGTDKMSVLKFMAAGMIFILAMPFVSRLIVWLLRVKTDERGIYEICFVFANVMFMGYPVSSALYGNDCIFYICIFSILFNLMYYTYGLRQITREKSGRVTGTTAIHAFLNNGTIASIISLILFVADVRLPDALIQTMNFTGDIATPLSMIIIGSSIATYSLKSIFDDKRIFAIAAIRLVGIPFLVYWYMTALGFSGEMRGIATITEGMPVASMVAMSSTEYGCHTRLANSAVVFTTLCGIALSPVMLLVVGHVA